MRIQGTNMMRSGTLLGYIGLGKNVPESPGSGSTTQLPWWDRFRPSSRSLCACGFWGHRRDGRTAAISGVWTMTGGEGRPWSRRLTNNSIAEAYSRPSDRCESLHIREDVLRPRRKGTWSFYRGLGRRFCRPFGRPDKEIFFMFSLKLWIRTESENYDFLQLRIPQLLKKCNWTLLFYGIVQTFFIKREARKKFQIIQMHLCYETKKSIYVL